jgi:hypothetical protein
MIKGGHFMIKSTCRYAAITLLTFLVTITAAMASCAGDGGGAPLPGTRSGYFRMESFAGGDDGPDRNKEKILVELYDVTELPPVAELEEHPDIKKELKSYIKLGYKYIKLEVTAVNGRKSRKIELYRGGGGSRGEKSPGS